MRDDVDRLMLTSRDGHEISSILARSCGAAAAVIIVFLVSTAVADNNSSISNANSTLGRIGGPASEQVTPLADHGVGASQLATLTLVGIIAEFFVGLMIFAEVYSNHASMRPWISTGEISALGDGWFGIPVCNYGDRPGVSIKVWLGAKVAQPATAPTTAPPQRGQAALMPAQTLHLKRQLDVGVTYDLRIEYEFRELLRFKRHGVTELTLTVQAADDIITSTLRVE